jgi:pSer/pThr/pTyr-binding forkhead associated (FHA) protein/S1-C subfamily serine protease
VPYIKLVESSRPSPEGGGGRTTEARQSPVRIGREPGSTIQFSGDAAKVVSTRHAELRFEGGSWAAVDLESRNGTYLNGRRLAATAPAPLKVGDVIRLGESGPELRVAAVTEGLDATLPEHSVMAAKPPEVRSYGVTLLAAATAKRYEARGTRIRLGRGNECEVQPVEAGHGETIVSRVHAELTVGPSGGLVLRDAESKNGTYLNGERITRAMPVRLGDKIMLGHGGPVLLVEGMGTAPVKSVPRPKPGAAGLGQQTVIGLIGQAIARARDEKKKGGRSTTAFMRAIAEEVGKDAGRKMRWLTSLVFLLVLLLGGAVYGVYWLLSQQAEHTEQALRTAEDSARAESERLRRELADARAAAAPAAQVDLLRSQLEAAQERTTQLEAALNRAQHALSDQLAAGESRREDAQRDLQRMRDQLAAAERRAPSQGLIDSLRRAVASAETQTATLDAKLRAIRATDFAGMAQQNQGAVGLITVTLGGSYYDGTGFVISPDGYMLTNWHVVADSTHAQPDTVWVTMADQSLARFADVVATSNERDIAIIKLRGYQGAALTAIDWKGTKARQGEPAALIGYPAGSGFARDRGGSVVRTSMTAGILSRVTSDLIQFDGMTTGGSSGSPVFNADGEVISVHRAGLRQGPGFALSVPVKYAIPLMPPALRQRLGL